MQLELFELRSLWHESRVGTFIDQGQESKMAASENKQTRTTKEGE